tara:strand:+ start:2074 stop:2232 length:159 start_codon:yes stop_codon:yes gene_type:complete
MENDGQDKDPKELNGCLAYAILLVPLLLIALYFFGIPLLRFTLNVLLQGMHI